MITLRYTVARGEAKGGVRTGLAKLDSDVSGALLYTNDSI